MNYPTTDTNMSLKTKLLNLQECRLKTSTPKDLGESRYGMMKINKSLNLLPIKCLGQQTRLVNFTAADGK